MRGERRPLGRRLPSAPRDWVALAGTRPGGTQRRDPRSRPAPRRRRPDPPRDVRFFRRLRRLLLLAVVLAGCVGTRSVRQVSEDAATRSLQDFESCGAGGACAIREQLLGQSWEQYEGADGEPFGLGVIEFNDDGHVKDLRQEQAVLGRIRELAAGGAILVVFAHGWHHGADPCDSNLTCFRAVLANLTASRERPVVGLYLAWRGKAFRRGALDVLSFYSRKNAAHRLGEHGARQVLQQLQEIYCDDAVNACNAEGQPTRTRLTMVTVGHSFGAAVVYSALENLMVRELGGVEHVVGPDPPSASDPKPIRLGLGDLVILINPAFEARRYHAFAGDLERPGAYSRHQYPVLLTVASRADSAVGFWFKVGRLLNLERLLLPHAKKGVTGFGHRRREITHRLTTVETGGARDADVSSCSCRMAEGTIAAAAEQHARFRWLWDGTFGPVRLEPVTPAHREHLPFLVAEAPAAVVGGHSRIFNDRFLAFLHEYIWEFVEQQSESSQPPVGLQPDRAKAPALDVP